MDLYLARMLWMYGGHLAAFLCCTWAFWKGGSPERIGAAIIASGWILTILLTSHAGHGPGQYVVTIDVCTLIGLAVLAIWSRRIWAFFAAACMFNSVMSHFTEALVHFGIYSYVTTIGIWGGWALLICLASGVWGHIRRGQREARQMAMSAA